MATEVRAAGLSILNTSPRRLAGEDRSADRTSQQPAHHRWLSGSRFRAKTSPTSSPANSVRGKDQLSVVTGCAWRALHLLRLSRDNGCMSITANQLPGESPERVAKRALDRVRRAAEAAPGSNVVELTIVGEELPVEIPAEMTGVVIAALESFAAGHHVSVLSRDDELTTVQAAEVLNVSRPYLIKLLESAEIDYRMVGTHRRVNTDSLLAYKARADARAHGAADELVRLTEDMGFDR
jgi:excisionase family DNA binding protein